MILGQVFCRTHPDPSPSGITLPDMKDVPFYEVVLEKRDDNAYLVTGNIKHCLSSLPAFNTLTMQ